MTAEPPQTLLAMVPRGTKGAKNETPEMGSMFKMKVLKFLRSSFSSPASSLQAMRRPWHIQKSKNVKGRPKIIGRACTAFKAAFGLSSLAEASKAHAAAPSVKAQKTLCAIGGSRTPLAARMSTIYEAESEEVTRYKTMQIKVTTVMKVAQPCPP